MSESDRVQRWRQRMRAEGKEPITGCTFQEAQAFKLGRNGRLLRSSNSLLAERQFPLQHRCTSPLHRLQYTSYTSLNMPKAPTWSNS